MHPIQDGVSSVDEPQFSIVTAVYNRQDTLGRCLDSIFAQTYPAHEVIVVDDGSTDESSDVALGFASTHRLRLIRSSNEGVGHARNMGIARASGDYLLFVDSDDAIESHMLEDLRKALRHHNSDVLCFGLKFCDPSLKVERELVIADGVWSDDAVSDAFSELFRCGLFGYMGAMAVRRELISSNGLLIREDLKRHSDLVFACEVFESASSIRTLDFAPYLYVQIEDAITARHMSDLLAVKSVVFKRLSATIAALNPPDGCELMISAAVSSAAAVLSNISLSPRVMSFRDLNAGLSHLSASNIGKYILSDPSASLNACSSKMETATVRLLCSPRTKTRALKLQALQVGLRIRNTARTLKRRIRRHRRSQA